MAEEQTKHHAAKRRHEEEAKPWRNWKRKSCLNVFLTVEVPSKGYCDLLEFLKDTKKRRTRYHRWRTQSAQSDEILFDSASTTFTYWPRRTWNDQHPLSVLVADYCTRKFDYSWTTWWSWRSRIKELLSSHEGEGSGFTLDSILDCQLNIATYDVVGGTTHTPLPKYIQSKNATVNIKNKDYKTFLYCLSYIRKPVVRNAQRPSHYTEELNNFDISGIKFPVTLNQIEKFEQQNQDFSVNVFKLDKKKEINLIPLYSTPERRRKYHANLLQIGNSQKPHYIVINNMSRLLFDKASDHNKMYICKYCIASVCERIRTLCAWMLITEQWL